MLLLMFKAVYKRNYVKLLNLFIVLYIYFRIGEMYENTVFIRFLVYFVTHFVWLTFMIELSMNGKLFFPNLQCKK